MRVLAILVVLALAAGCGGEDETNSPECVPAVSLQEVHADGCVYVRNLSADGVTCSAVSWC